MLHVSAYAEPFLPPSGKTLLSIGVNNESIEHYVKAAGSAPGGVVFFTSIQKLDSLEGPSDPGTGIQDGTALLHAYPNSVIHIGLYMVNALPDVISGKYDDHLVRLAKWIKKANRPVYLRIGYEFDNPDNHYDPEEYKKSFRYVVDFLRKQGVHNAAYVWHSQCWNKSNQDVMSWYPGDDYVDWFAASLFSMPVGLWYTSDFIKLARQHQKPFMIAESTPWGMYTDPGKIDWLTKVFRFIREQHVEIFCYFDYDWDKWPLWKGMHIGDGRVENDPKTKELWFEETNKDDYLKASKDLFKKLGWK